MKLEKMHYLYLIIFLFITSNITIQVKAQTGNQLDSIINYGLLHVLNSTQEYYLKQFKGERSLSHDYYVFTDRFPPNLEFSSAVKSTGVQFTSLENLSEKQKKEGVFGLLFTGITIHDDNLIISFVDEGIKIEGEKLVESLADGYRFSYKFSCETMKWELK